MTPPWFSKYSPSFSFRDYRQSPSFWLFTLTTHNSDWLFRGNLSTSVQHAPAAINTRRLRMIWKVIRTSHSKIIRPWRVRSLGFVCSPSFFSLPAASRLSWWGDFHTRSRFARSNIPEGKRGTTRSISKCHVSYLIRVAVSIFPLCWGASRWTEPVPGYLTFIPLFPVRAIQVSCQLQTITFTHLLYTQLALVTHVIKTVSSLLAVNQVSKPTTTLKVEK